MYNLICYDSKGRAISSFTQWDSGQTITIRNLSFEIAPIVHFANKNSEEAISVQASVSQGNITAEVPNILLEESLTIYIYIFESNDNGGRTLYSLSIPIDPKPKPNDYIYVNNVEYVSITNVLNEIREFENQIKENTKIEVLSETDESYIIKLSLNGNEIITPNLKGSKGADYTLTENDKQEIADIVKKISGKKLTTFFCSSLEELYQAAEDITVNFNNYSPVLLVPIFEDKENDIEYGCGQIIVDSDGSGSIDSSIVLPLCYVEKPFTNAKDVALEACNTFVQQFDTNTGYRVLDKPEGEPEGAERTGISYYEYTKVAGVPFSTYKPQYFIYDMNANPDNSYLKGTVNLLINNSICNLDLNDIYTPGSVINLYLEIVFTIDGLIFINGTAKSSTGELAIHKNVSGNNTPYANKISIENSATINHAYCRRY